MKIDGKDLHVCVHCEGGGCASCNKTGICGDIDLFEDLSKRIRNIASKSDLIIFNQKMKDIERKSLIEDVAVLHIFFSSAYHEASPILERYMVILSDNKEKPKKRTNGSWYTPPYIADYIVKFTLGPLVKKAKRSKNVRRKILNILNLKCCDPCCGAGIFLVSAHDYLMGEIMGIDKNADLFKLSSEVATKCLYGVDINPDAIESCRTMLQLNIAKWGLKHEIEEVASSAVKNSFSQNDKCDNKEKPLSVKEHVQENSSTIKTT